MDEKMNYYEDDVRDYGFDENDVQFFMMDVEGRSIEKRKNRNWFFNDEIDEMDYNISYSVLVDGKVFITFPDSVDSLTVESFIVAQFEKDDEATDSIEESCAIQESERRFGA
jgi:hypothetical protein